MVTVHPRPAVLIRQPLERWKLHLFWCIGVAVVSLWLRAAFPVMALGFAIHDDQLFVRTAEYLSSGQWLGPYDNRTLVKGIGYPLFISLASLTGLPLKIAEQSLYLSVSAFLSLIAARASARRQVGSALFTALAFNPALWGPELARVIREGLYISLSPAVIGFAVLVAFPPRARHLLRSALAGCLLGLTGAAFSLTREEGIWLVPALLAIFFIAAIDAARPGRSIRSNRFSAQFLPVGLSLLLAVSAYDACLHAVRSENHRLYGVALLNEIQSKAFERAYGALTRIKPPKWQRYVVFPSDVRRQAYAASPAARELKPYFEGQLDQRWRGYGCDQMGIAPRDCPEILSGWFFWALRDAVTDAGYRSAPASQGFYNRLADEIDAACQQGKLQCLPSRITLAPPFRWEYLADTLAPAVRIARYLLSVHQSSIGSRPSFGNDADLDAFQDAAGPLSRPDPPSQRVRGWVEAFATTPTIRLVAPLGSTALSSMVLEKADDVQAAFPGSGAVRFSIESRCVGKPCSLKIDAPDLQEVSIAWQHLKPGMVFDNRQIRVFIDAVSPSVDQSMTARRRTVQVALATVVAKAYWLATPPLSALGLLGIIAAGAQWRKRAVPGAVFALSVASVIAVVCRVMLLAYLDATSLPAANFLYVSPATPFVIVVAVLGIWLGLSRFTARDCNLRAATLETAAL